MGLAPSTCGSMGQRPPMVLAASCLRSAGPTATPFQFPNWLAIYRRVSTSLPQHRFHRFCERPRTGHAGPVGNRAASDGRRVTSAHAAVGSEQRALGRARNSLLLESSGCARCFLFLRMILSNAKPFRPGLVLVQLLGWGIAQRRPRHTALRSHD